VNLFALATPIYVIQVLQRYVAYGVTSTLITLVVGITFVSIFEFFFRNIRHRMTRELDEINTLLADQVMKKLTVIKTSYYAIQKQFRSDVITGHMQTVQNTLNASTILVIVDVPFVSVFLAALYLIHYQLGIIATVIIFFPLILAAFYTSPINKLNRESHLNAINSARLHYNVVSRYETIRYFNLIEAIRKSWATIINQIVSIREKLEANKSVLSSLMSSVATLLTIIIIGWGAVLAVDGEISVGALIGANILAARAIAPIIRFVQCYEPLSKSDKSLAELNSLFTLPQDKDSGTEIKDFSGKLIIKNLIFKYPQNKNPVFEGLSLDILPEEVTVIRGSNGSGKTTLIKTLAGILDFERGQIFLDDIEISQISPQWIRKNLTYMPQEPNFVDGTFLDNLIGIREIEKSTFHETLKLVDLENFVNSDPEGVNLLLSDRGENLPSGIRKRMALARALLVGGQLVLLDEPTEGLDEKGKESIYLLIEKLLSMKKTVVISTLDEEIMNKANLSIDLDHKPKPAISRGNIKYKLK
jgi:ATP-binding cassette subfamily C protein LapB